MGKKRERNREDFTFAGVFVACGFQQHIFSYRFHRRFVAIHAAICADRGLMRIEKKFDLCVLALNMLYM